MTLTKEQTLLLWEETYNLVTAARNEAKGGSPRRQAHREKSTKQSAERLCELLANLEGESDDESGAAEAASA